MGDEGTNICHVVFSFEQIQSNNNDHDHDHDHGVEDLHSLKHEGMHNDALETASFEHLFRSNDVENN
jgi:hypothetical protein